MKVFWETKVIARITYKSSITILPIKVTYLAVIPNKYPDLKLKIEILSFCDFKYEWTDLFSVELATPGERSVFLSKSFSNGGTLELGCFLKTRNRVELIHSLPEYIFNKGKFSDFTILLYKLFYDYDRFGIYNNKIVSLDRVIKRQLYLKEPTALYYHNGESIEQLTYCKDDTFSIYQNLFANLNGYYSKDLYIVDDYRISQEIGFCPLMYAYSFDKDFNDSFIDKLFPDNKIPLEMQQLFGLRYTKSMKSKEGINLKQVRKVSLTNSFPQVSGCYEFNLKNKHNPVFIQDDFVIKLNIKGTLK